MSCFKMQILELEDGRMQALGCKIVSNHLELLKELFPGEAGLLTQVISSKGSTDNGFNVCLRLSALHLASTERLVDIRWNLKMANLADCTDYVCSPTTLKLLDGRQYKLMAKRFDGKLSGLEEVMTCLG